METKGTFDDNPPHVTLMNVEPNLSELEKKLLGSDKPDLACGALVASGIKNQRLIDDYLAKIDILCQQFAVNSSFEDDLKKAKALFEWLWTIKSNRYAYGGNFKLTEVIKAQIDPGSEKMGNCLGLTLLYNVLAQKCSLKTKAVYLEEAFGRQSHVFSTLDTDRGTIDVDNIFPHGFDFKEHLGNPQRIQWGDAELIADIYHSIGWRLHEQGKLEEAIQNYGKAIWLNPKYAKAYFNRGIALSMLGRDEEARQDFEFSEE